MRRLTFFNKSKSESSDENADTLAVLNEEQRQRVSALIQARDLIAERSTFGFGPVKVSELIPLAQWILDGTTHEIKWTAVDPDTGEDIDGDELVDKFVHDGDDDV